MTSQSLGARLAQNTEDTRLREEAEARARDAAAAAKAAAEYQTVADFLARCQHQFATQILNGAPMREVKVKLGQGENSEVRMLLRTSQFDGSGVPVALSSSSGAFHLAWRNFEVWTSENGLRSHWMQESDGGGQQSWDWFSVRPL